MTRPLSRIVSGPLIHVLCFSAFPVVFLWAHNLDDLISLRSALPPMLVIWTVALVVLALLRAVLGDWMRAGFVTSLLVVLFFSFGHVRDAVDPSGTGNKDPRLFLMTGLLLFVGVTLALRAGRYAPGATRSLNVIAVALVVLNLVPFVTEDRGSASPLLAPDELPGVDPAQVEPGRDVYYLIFDRYAGVATLRDLYGFDNRPFLEALRSRGFFVAEESLANYPKTPQSLASSLSMSYLDEIAEREGPESDDWIPVLASLNGSRVSSSFQRLGYRYEHVGSWWDPTREDRTADRSYDPLRVSEFSGVLLETTMWPTVAPILGFESSFERRQYERARFQFSTVRRIARDPRPTFTFSHFLLPHPDYVFHADGRFMPPEVAARMGERRAYLEQLRYTNDRILELVDELLAGPAREDPIIVIQSDEGPNPRAVEEDELSYDWFRASDSDLGLKLRILNAYYLPGEGAEPYPTISPVNTFRLIFSRYFGADLPLIEDRTYVFQDASHPYRYREVTARLRS